MKRLFFITLSILLALSIIRMILGNNEPMTLTRFLSSLSNLRLSFENTLEQIVKLRESLVFPVMEDVSIWKQIENFFSWFYLLVNNLLFVPIEILHDTLDFLASVLGFFNALLS